MIQNMKWQYKMLYSQLEKTTVGDDMTCQENKRKTYNITFRNIFE